MYLISISFDFNYKAGPSTACLQDHGEKNWCLKDGYSVKTEADCTSRGCCWNSQRHSCHKSDKSNTGKFVESFALKGEAASIAPKYFVCVVISQLRRYWPAHENSSRWAMRYVLIYGFTSNKLWFTDWKTNIQLRTSKQSVFTKVS